VKSESTKKLLNLQPAKSGLNRRKQSKFL
jgi:hypothetical protein